MTEIVLNKISQKESLLDGYLVAHVTFAPLVPWAVRESQGRLQAPRPHIAWN